MTATTKTLDFLSSTAGKVTTIITLLVMLASGAFSFFNWQASLVREADLQVQLQDIATRTEVAMKMNDLAIELVTVTIMSYEDELVELSFLVESGEATPMDRVKHQNTINRLEDLRKKLGRLEDTAAELQRVGTRDITQTGSKAAE
jgi:hypothetical protein